MHRNITIDEKAYNLLASLKTNPQDSFTKVILRHVRRPAETGMELMERFDEMGPPPVQVENVRYVIRNRGRRSNRK